MDFPSLLGHRHPLAHVSNFPCATWNCCTRNIHVLCCVIFLTLKNSKHLLLSLRPVFFWGTTSLSPSQVVASFPQISCILGMGREIVVTLGHSFASRSLLLILVVWEDVDNKTTAKTGSSEGGARQLSPSLLPLHCSQGHLSAFNEHLACGWRSSFSPQTLYNFPVPSVFAWRICPTWWPWIFNLLLTFLTESPTLMVTPWIMHPQ